MIKNFKALKILFSKLRKVSINIIYPIAFYHPGFIKRLLHEFVPILVGNKSVEETEHCYLCYVLRSGSSSLSQFFGL